MPEQRFKIAEKWLWGIACVVATVAALLILYVRHRLAPFGINFPF